ncbi:PPC domain-containing DNA-binding protein [Elusimicrobiota bacterium]
MRFKREGTRYFVRLERGEEVVESLVKFAKDENIASGSFTAIGAVDDPVLGYYDLPNKTYLKKELPGEYEVAGLTGDFTELDGEPMAHIHAVLSDAGCRTLGGHVFKATVSLTLEVAVQAYPFKMKRKPDEVTGLKLIEM